MTSALLGQLVSGATCILLLALAGYGVANLRARVPGTGYFVALTVAAAVWALGYAVEKAQTLAEGYLLATQIEYLGLAYVPTLWLLVALHWMEHPWAKSRGLKVLVLGLSTTLATLVWTNDLHHLWYTSIVPLTPGFARFDRGPLYYPFFTFLVSTFVLSSVLMLLRPRGRQAMKIRSGIILLVNVIPVTAAVAYQLGFRPAHLDPTVFSMVPAFSVLAWGLFRHDFIRIVPIARETVIDSMDQAVLVLDDEGRLVDHNAAAEFLLETLDIILPLMVSARGEVQVEGEGGHRTLRFRRSVIPGIGGAPRGAVLILTDVTEERRLLDELAHQASHDALTGIANRRHFEEHALGEITRALRHGGTLALVIFDLDHFKQVNDRWGHPGGDQVLRAVVTAIAPRLRPYDLFARVGGEEFTILMPEAHPLEAREAAERWRAALETFRIDLPEGPVSITASFGVATLQDLPLTLSPDPRVRLDALMGLADQALYRAKAGGRNRVM